MRNIMTLLLLAGLLAGCDFRSNQQSPLAIIDAHTHTDFEGVPEPFSGVPLTKEQYFKEMKEIGVVGAIAHTFEYDEDYEDLKQHGIIHCAGIREKVNIKILEQGLKSRKYACMKIYLGYVYRYANDPVYKPVYKLAEKYDVPVVFHTGDTYDSDGKLKYADPMTIDEIAVDYRKVRFVLAHCGNPWIQTAAEVAYKNPNVYLDGSGLLVGDLKKMSAHDVEEYMVKPLRWAFGYMENPEKLLYGSDWPVTYMDGYLQAFKRAIPPEHWQAVFHDNAERVFRLKKP